MNLFFSQEIANNFITLSEDESKHVVKVMRAAENSEIVVTDGKGGHYKTIITESKAKKCILKVTEKFTSPPEPEYHLHIAIAPTKNHDRFEWFAEKATEIGISEITPLICRHSEREKIHPERLERIMIAAMKQSQRFWLPKLNAPTYFDDFVKQNPGYKKYIACCSKQDIKNLCQAYTHEADALILIGPEGDFSPEEINLAFKNSFQPVSLGGNRYRTETAALMACHTIALLNP